MVLLGLMVVVGPAIGAEPKDPSLDRLMHFDRSDGLPHESVWDLHEDSQGFFWLGTQDGLCRFDGYEFDCFRHDAQDSSSIPVSEVLEIFEDAEGGLWLVSRFRVSRLSADRQRFEHVWPPSGAESGPVGVSKFLELGSELFLVTSRGLWRAYRSGSATSVSFERMVEGEAYDLVADRKGRLWLAGDFGLKIRPASDEPWGDVVLSSTEAPLPAYGLTLDGSESLWIGSAEGLWTLETSRADAVPSRIEGSEELGWFEGPVPGPSGERWVVSQSGIARVDPLRREVEVLDCVGCTGRIDAVDILVDRSGGVWISTMSQGVLNYDPRLGKLRSFRHDPKVSGSLSSDSVLCLEEDSNGDIWFCTYTGIDKYVPERELFTIYDAAPARGGLAGSEIWPILEQDDNILWVGSYSAGLSRLDRQAGTSTTFSPDPKNDRSLSHSIVTSLARQGDGTLWVGTREGLNRLRASGGEPNLKAGFDRFLPDENDSRSVGAWEIHCLMVDRRERLWVAHDEGLDRFDGEGFVHYPIGDDAAPGLVAEPYYSIVELRDGRLAVPSLDDGLSILDPETGASENFRHGKGGLSANEVAAVSEAEDGALWLGYYGHGLDLWKDGEMLAHFDESHGLANNSVVGILPGANGELWLSTYTGLTRFDPVTGTFRNFDTFDGLPDGVFSSGSYYRNPAGQLFFGSSKGLVTFDPADFPMTGPDDLDVVLTGFELAYEPVALQVEDPSSPLLKPIHDTDELTLSHRQKIASFQFAALGASMPEKVSYRYRLEGFDPGWNEVEADRRSAVYSNLDAGAYTLQIQARHEPEPWDEGSTRELRLKVLPPPWQTWWAYTLYTLFGAGSMAGFFLGQQRKLERERRLSARLQQVDRMKDELLANTSHELRTPLYGIMGLAESLREGARGAVNEEMQADLDMIVAGSRRLSGLVNDLLDHSKMKQGRLQLDRRATDLHALTDVVVTLLRPLADTRSLELRNEIDADLPPVPADAARLQQVLINLVGNGLKFTESGSVTVRAEIIEAATVNDGVGGFEERGRRMEIRVVDTGIGIPENVQERIFEAFEQADASTERIYGGTGLGLAVSKQLVDLHDGDIRIESETGKGATFIVSLPLDVELDRDSPGPVVAEPSSRRPRDLEPMPESVSSSSAPVSSPAVRQETLQDGEIHVLVVDDEPIVRQVTDAYLQGTPFKPTAVASGQEALDVLARRDDIDLVILDVMMPHLSGYETCRRIRAQHDAEDLPILFLTAKSQPEDLVAGFAAGGNDYLHKPIARQALLARLGLHLQLLQARRQNLLEIKTLQGVLPICVHCKNIRDDDGFWSALEQYLVQNSGATLSHSLCPPCAQKLYPDHAVQQPDPIPGIVAD